MLFLDIKNSNNWCGNVIYDWINNSLKCIKILIQFWVIETTLEIEYSSIESSIHVHVNIIVTGCEWLTLFGGWGVNDECEPRNVFFIIRWTSSANHNGFNLAPQFISIFMTTSQRRTKWISLIYRAECKSLIYNTSSKV